MLRMIPLAACGVLAQVLVQVLVLVLAGAAAAQTPAARVEPIPDALWRMMQGRSWRAELPCPPRDALALLHAPYRDFEGRARMGALVVARSAAPALGSVFEELFAADFRIARMEPIDAFGGSDDASMAANNTSAFNCRLVEGGRGMSKHARGLAVDVNPIQNPYVDARGVAPPAGAPYADRRARRAPVTGMVRRDDVAVRAFRRIGWAWGGDFRVTPDYQHFYAR
ncbi:MAG TPA: M15 family metallopeptidase [Beijerinckiaceae bacterium]|jgi:poly-gamma-glutamate synthesis protein (capsule biosynthesis protein)